MDMVSINGPTDAHTLANGSIIRSMDMGNTFGQIVEFMKGIG